MAIQFFLVGISFHGAKKQPTISRSSSESEYRAMANTASEIIWITHLLRDLNALPPGIRHSFV